MKERPYQLIRVRSEGPVAKITLANTARKNAIGPVMVSELLYAFEDAMEDAEVRVVELGGEGDAFCAGGDFSQMVGGGPSPGEALPGRGDYADLLQAMVRAAKPIVARVHGAAMGGGLGLVAASHFAVAARGVKLGTPEINVGLFPMMIMAILSRLVPRRKLLEMMLFGEKIDADQAAAIGLVNRVVDAGELDAAVAALTGAIASKSPTAIRHGLEAFAAQDDARFEDALPDLRNRLAGVLSTEDAREGLTAFLQKRQPQWTGR